MQISDTATINVSSNALIQKVSEEMVILDSESGQYYTLNEVASDMLGQLQNGHSVLQTAEYICSEYTADQDEVLSDIKEMLTHLVSKELVSIAE